MHVMFDLETWGTTPGSDIRSIGACVFVPQSRHDGWLVHDGSLGTIRPFYIACDNPQVARDKYLGDLATSAKYPLTRDPRTVQWWSEQSDEAQTAFADPIDLADALDRFIWWLRVVSADDSAGVHLWSHGPQFDVSILTAAYDAVRLPVPWHYRAPRDTRTLFDAAGIEDHSAWLKQHAHGTAHNALDDAVTQARAVCAAWSRINVSAR